MPLRSAVASPMNEAIRVIAGVLTAVAGGSISMLKWVPHNVTTAALVMAGFTLLDFCTATWGAALLGQISSTVMRKKFSAKALQYAAVLGVSSGVAALSGQWFFVYAGLFFVVGTEATSVIENALLLESVGVSMGPFKPLLDRIRGFFAITNVLLAPAPPQTDPEATAAGAGGSGDTTTTTTTTTTSGSTGAARTTTTTNQEKDHV